MSMKFIPFRGALKAKASPDGSVTIAGYGNKKTIDAIGDLMYSGEDNVDLTRFNKNPIMFFNHDRNQPIGRWVKVELRPDGLWLEGKLSASEVPEIKKIRDLVREGILNSLSIGYDELESERDFQGVNHVTKWKLNEVSVVSIPCNEDSVFDLGKAKALANEIQKTKTMDEARIVMGMENENVEPKEPTEPVVKADDEGKPDDEGKDFQECVQSKIPKLIDEGKPQEEAVAIAMSMCSEENGKCGFTSEHLKSALELAAKLISDKQDEKGKGDEEEKPKGDDMDEDEEDKEQKPDHYEDDEEKNEKTITTPMPKEDDTDFGNPYMEIAKSQLALMGQISTQLGELLSVAEKLSMFAINPQITDNENDTQPDMESQESTAPEYSASDVAELLNIARQVKDITSQYIK